MAMHENVSSKAICELMCSLKMALKQVWGCESLCTFLTGVSDAFVFGHVFLVIAFTGKHFLTSAAPISELPGMLYHVRFQAGCCSVRLWTLGTHKHVSFSFIFCLIRLIDKSIVS